MTNAARLYVVFIIEVGNKHQNRSKDLAGFAGLHQLFFPWCPVSAQMLARLHGDPGLRSYLSRHLASHHHRDSGDGPNRGVLK